MPIQERFAYIKSNISVSLEILFSSCKNRLKLTDWTSWNLFGRTVFFLSKSQNSYPISQYRYVQLYWSQSGQFFNVPNNNRNILFLHSRFSGQDVFCQLKHINQSDSFFFWSDTFLFWLKNPVPRIFPSLDLKSYPGSLKPMEPISSMIKTLT